LSPRQRSLIDLIVDVGELPHNEPSTVIDTTLDDVSVLRQGSIEFTEKTSQITHSEQETQELGKKLVSKYKNLLTYKAVIFCLVGEMGAGKTQLCKGIARGLGIKEIVVSPTFILSHNYPFEAEGKKTEFIHIDTWRLFNDQEFLDLGFAKMVDGCAVIAVEWADRIAEVLKQYGDEAKLIWVKLSYGTKENDRTIEYSDKFGKTA
jgi:tRNA threonylcarbamoyladenosine biosynthesis protein TsaE